MISNLILFKFILLKFIISLLIVKARIRLSQKINTKYKYKRNQYIQKFLSYIKVPLIIKIY